ncbi:glycoside hydrolase family 35 protein [Apiospora phragmitis]|uniref:Glycoside hydrolase family 35 protein n=1 Tax=Apiospora phragmitis TaxID=2905665 RepID=A0ABR1VF24_9PEZI
MEFSQGKTDTSYRVSPDYVGKTASKRPGEHECPPASDIDCNLGCVKRHQIISGQIDPQRVPRAYWGQRLQMAKAMGLNTILSKFDFTDRNDVAAWLQEIQDAGLKAALRPGPYVGAQVKPYLVTNGDPVLMVQIENKYGYAGNDKNYLRALADIAKPSFPGMKLYTNDGAQSGALAVVDGTDSRSGFNLLRQAITDQSSVGPLMNGEYWVRWFDSWGLCNGHSSYDGDTNGQSGRASELDWVLSNGNHISIFMFHGGTSWDFGNGAADAKPVQAFTTSYDYGAPLDETGRPAQIYTAFRSVITKRVSGVPAVSSTPPLMTVPDFALTPVLGLLDDLPSSSPRPAPSPFAMEATGQVFGYLLYEYVATGSASGAVARRDRVVVYVNGARRGVIDGIYRSPASVSVTLARGDRLWLLAENLGRADNGISDQTKGILGDVKGVVFVNGHNLGRYWTVGPQQELFLPEAYLKQGEENEVLVLESEPGTSSRVARGVVKRTWKNNPDPDCNNCS